MLLSKENSSILTTNAEWGAKDGSAYALQRIKCGRDAALDVPVPFWYRSSLGNDLNPAVQADGGGDKEGRRGRERQKREGKSPVFARL